MSASPTYFFVRGCSVDNGSHQYPPRASMIILSRCPTTPGVIPPPTARSYSRLCCTPEKKHTHTQTISTLTSHSTKARRKTTERSTPPESGTTTTTKDNENELSHSLPHLDAVRQGFRGGSPRLPPRAASDSSHGGRGSPVTQKRRLTGRGVAFKNKKQTPERGMRLYPGVKAKSCARRVRGHGDGGPRRERNA